MKFDIVTRKNVFFLEKKILDHSNAISGILQHPEIGSKFNFERIWGLFFGYLANSWYYNFYISLKYIKFVVQWAKKKLEFFTVKLIFFVRKPEKVKNDPSSQSCNFWRVIQKNVKITWKVLRRYMSVTVIKEIQTFLLIDSATEP